MNVSSELVCPNPSKCVGEVTLADGTVLGIRPIRREDEPLVVKFHASLSEQSVYRRYFELPGNADAPRAAEANLLNRLSEGDGSDRRTRGVERGFRHRWGRTINEEPGTM